MLRLLVGAAILLGGLMTTIGVLAPLFPQADMTNHFRPYTLAGTGALLVLARATRTSGAVRWGAILTALNAALLVLPLSWSAETTSRQASGQALATPGHRDLKIVTFNMLWRNRQEENVAHFLMRKDADIILLQEVTQNHVATLHSVLGAKYPHSHVCLVFRACRQAIFAKRPWVSIEHFYRGTQTPEMISALFDDVEFGKFRLHGVHAGIAYRPRQAQHVDWLIALRMSTTEPAIFAGDFNMTPWSYQLQRLLAATGMRRHATFLRSWPTGGQFGLPAPAFLIDHVLSTPDIRTVSIETGPHLGSDHLPIVAWLRLPLPPS